MVGPIQSILSRLAHKILWTFCMTNSRILGKHRGTSWKAYSLHCILSTSLSCSQVQQRWVHNLKHWRLLFQANRKKIQSLASDPDKATRRNLHLFKIHTWQKLPRSVAPSHGYYLQRKLQGSLWVLCLRLRDLWLSVLTWGICMELWGMTLYVKYLTLP